MPQPDDQQELAPWEVWSYHNNYDYKWWWNPSAEALDEARKRFAARMKKVREAEDARAAEHLAKKRCSRRCAVA